ncbi:MAG: deoxyguanosinetriphosphate triphosphohydrolase [Pseudomonadota bacterium]
MLDRAKIEYREARELAPYATCSADSRGRAHPEAEHPLRSAYQRDRERVIHSSAFRRLQYKTQVFVNHEGDHYRTRLTHTMEVAQIARAAARMLNLNEDLTEAIALAHDLGHTPFGHSGEDALRELMKNHGGFEHNVHGLRVVDVLERRYPGFRGLNLTWEVRESIAKHTTTYDHPSVREFDPELRPLVEAQVVEVADGIAYTSHDLDDALAAGILDEGVYDEVELLRRVARKVEDRHPHLDPRYRRHEIIRTLINLLVTDICNCTTARIRETGIAATGDVRRAPQNVVCFSPELGQLKEELQSFLFTNVYGHYRVARMAHKAKRFVEQLFSAFIAQPKQLPPYYQAWAKQGGLHQGVCDYIAGMTDRFAQDEYMRLFTPFERV